MRRRGAGRVLGFTAFSLCVCVVAALLGTSVYNEADGFRHRDANSVLSFYQQTMTLKLQGDLSRAGALAAVVEADPDDEERFAAAAGEMLARDGVAYVAYVQDETMRAAYPESEFGDAAGRSLSSFSYIYTLAKVTGDFVVEGPVELANGEEAFLFIQPLDVDGAYYGEVVVGLEADYVIEQMGFSALEESGYRYELWAVSAQDGSKDVIAASEGGRDFSSAAKISFSMPTLWTLSIMPSDGWVPSEWTAAIVAGSAAFALLVIGFVGAVLRARRMRRQIREERRIDPETGLLTYDALVDVLEQEAERCKGPRQPLTLICLTVDDFEHIALALGWKERRRYLRTVADEIDLVVHGDHLAARVSGGYFAVAIREHVDRRTLGDLMRALELSLLWKVRVDGKKVFCRVRSAAVHCPEDGNDPAALIERTVSLLERDKPDKFARKGRG